MNENKMSQYLTSEIIEKQESLSEELLNTILNINQKNVIDFDKDRPKESFYELMKWAENNFSVFLKDKINLNKFVHNKIIIDGQFLTFAKENNIKITCLHKDAIISWKTDCNYEKYFVQGAFLIQHKGYEFLQFSCYHKGNQHEDEVSFFIIVSAKNYQPYIELRNSFEEWVQQRDRSNLHIRVIDGEDIPYTKDHNWADLFLPQNLKDDLQSIVENFLSSKDFYLKNKIPWKRGIILYGKPGCHAIGTPILMHNGTWKNAEDIKVNDLLMGPDSKPREVLKLVRGKEKMYKIIPNKGKSFTVNENHILHLHYSSSKQKNFPQDINLSVKEYLQVSKSLKEKLKLVKSPLLRFDNNEKLEINPYILGTLLSDDTPINLKIISADGEFNKALRNLNIFDKKEIPQKYLTANEKSRLQLLAGLIDGSEKYNKKGHKNCFDFVQKDLNLSNQIVNLALSLGFGCTIKTINFSGTYNRLSIYGDIYKIPTQLQQVLQEKPNKNCRFIGIQSIKEVGINDYYGFTVDEDHLYVMDDFWISHNCGKTSIIRTLISVYNFKPVTITSNANDDTVREAFSYAESQSPALLYFEDIDTLFEKVDVSSFLNLMDGIATKNGLFVMATANDMTKLKPSITDRPSRFDRKFEIPLPNQKMSYIYLKKWFGKLLPDAEFKKLSELAETYKFSYVYLKELYISSMYEALSSNRKSPTKKDVDKALKCLIKDKNILKHNKSIDTQKYLK